MGLLFNVSALILCIVLNDQDFVFMVFTLKQDSGIHLHCLLDSDTQSRRYLELCGC